MLPAFKLQTFPASAQWKAVCWTGTLFCVLGYFTDNAMVSTTGTTDSWTEYDLSAVTQGVLDAAGENANILAVGEQDFDTFSYCLRSSNSGATWVKSAMPTKTAYTGICKGSSRYIAVAITDSGNAAATSDDNGASWTLRALANTIDWAGVAGTSVAIVTAGEQSYSVSTDNGVTWSSPTALTMPGGYETDVIKKVIEFGGNFIIMFEYCLAVSVDDGASWTVSVGPGDGRYVLGASNEFGVFIASEFYGQVHYSEDGTNWISGAREFPSGIDGAGGTVSNESTFVMIRIYSSTYDLSTGFINNASFLSFSA